MAHVATLILLLPLVGFIFVLANGTGLKERYVGMVATGVVALSFVMSVVVFVLLLHRSNREVTVHLFNWIPVGTLHVPAALLVDPLSVTMCLFVTGISALIHLYSIGYMRGEKDYRKFFLYMNLFVFSMLLLVLANNLVLTFVGWEGVGVCSYWLIAYYFTKDAAASAGWGWRHPQTIWSSPSSAGRGSVSVPTGSSPTTSRRTPRRPPGRRPFSTTASVTLDYSSDRTSV